MTAERQGRFRLLLSAAIILYLLVVLAAFDTPLVTRLYYLRQDAIGGAVLVLTLAGVALWPARQGSGTAFATMPSARAVLLAAAGLTVLLWAGTHWVMLDYPLTRDELMANFDAAIYAGSRLAEPVAPEWRDVLPALVPAFALPVEGNAAVVSNYLPTNALMRAAFATFGRADLLNPLLAGAGLVAMWDAARRVFADCPQAVWMVLAGYVLSAQVLATAMTPYAMTGHLALNAAWLALFLRDRPWSHAAAMAVGAWATGLHQIVFHPLFAGPVILTLLARRRWLLFGLYSLVYAAILLAWMRYPGVVLDSVGVAGAAGSGAGVGGGSAGSFLADRVLPLLAAFQSSSFVFMGYNLLRFFVWNAGFVLPLLLWSIRPAVRGNKLALALLASLAGTTLAATVLLAYQGHGWGYRYWHGEIPAILMLCGFGFRAWQERSPAAAAGAARMLGAVSAVLIVFLLVSANRFVAPYAALSERIARQPAELVILETEAPQSAIDQVRNRPDFSNRPLILSSGDLDMRQVRALCRRGSVTFLRKDSFTLMPFGADPGFRDDPYRNMARYLRAQPCWREAAS